MRYIAKVLTFRFTAEDVANATYRDLAIGLLFTWAAGIGRYWDNPRANTLQHLGIGSILYVFALSTFLWLLLWPLRTGNWSYRHVLTFITAVSPPAVLYAIPVERFLSLEDAQMANFWFLAIVAAWRVALYLTFLVRYARLPGLGLVVAAVFPLTIIIFALTALNLERAVFELMAGNDRTSGTSADAAYGVLFLLTLVSFYAAPASGVLYLIAVWDSYVRRKAQRS